MSRPRLDQKDPLRRLLRSWSQGEGVEPEHREHLLALGRDAVSGATEEPFHELREFG